MGDAAGVAPVWKCHTRVPVRASLCTGAERERLWALLAGVWPAYETYDRRAGRELRVFRLTPEQ